MIYTMTGRDSRYCPSDLSCVYSRALAEGLGHPAHVAAHRRLARRHARLACGCAGALAQPRAAVLNAYRVTGRVHEIQAVETILGVLREAGFPDAGAVRVYHAFADQAFAFGALDSASTALPRAARDAESAVWRATYARLPAETHQHIAAPARHLVADMRFSSYPAALDLLLSAAEARLAEFRGRT
jgi:hypothetical protein